MRLPSGDAATALITPLTVGANGSSAPVSMSYASTFDRAVSAVPGAAFGSRALSNLPTAYTVDPIVVCAHT